MCGRQQLCLAFDSCRISVGQKFTFLQVLAHSGFFEQLFGVDGFLAWCPRGVLALWGGELELSQELQKLSSDIGASFDVALTEDFGLGFLDVCTICRFCGQARLIRFVIDSFFFGFEA